MLQARVTERRRDTPSPSSPAASAMGRANRPRDTSPELLLRQELHRRGLRYRVHRRPEPAIRTTPDVVFGPARVVVFVDGCFWHRCPDHGVLPKRNGDWWRAKLIANEERDRRNDEALAACGWRVIRIWEHEDPSVAADRLCEILACRHL